MWATCREADALGHGVVHAANPRVEAGGGGPGGTGESVNRLLSDAKVSQQIHRNMDKLLQYLTLYQPSQSNCC